MAEPSTFQPSKDHTQAPTQSQTAASAIRPAPTQAAAPAAPGYTQPNETASPPADCQLPAAKVVTFSDVRDNLLDDQDEVNVFATGTFENCPDQVLSDD